MALALPYCGSAPVPGELLGRFNLDPVLIAALLVLLGVQLRVVQGRGAAIATAAGWLAAAAALISPLCALSVALFSARLAQHMVLILVAAPLIARALPAPAGRPVALWAAVAGFTATLWFWHMPAPYAASFISDTVYWLMHLTLSGSAVLLWRELLQARTERAAMLVAAGGIASVQMGLLGAVLSFAAHPLYAWHLTRTQAWGFTPLQDQQLGGALMWVPGIALFLWAALRSVHGAWAQAERA